MEMMDDAPSSGTYMPTLIPYEPGHAHARTRERTLLNNIPIYAHTHISEHPSLESILDTKAISHSGVTDLGHLSAEQPS